MRFANTPTLRVKGNQMDWTFVNSSAIVACAYSEGNLYIRFTNGTAYLYKNVPLNVYEELVKADSVGKYHAQHIKRAYDYVKVAL